MNRPGGQPLPGSSGPVHPVDEAAQDRAVGLLRDLLAEVERNLPGAPASGPARRAGERPAEAGSSEEPAPSTVAPLRRFTGRGPVVDVVAAGLLSFGGVAAASTQVGADHPLSGLGALVRNVTGAGPAGEGPAPSAGDRTDAELGALLREAAELIDRGGGPVAAERLARVAERLSRSGLPAADPLRVRAAELQARLPTGPSGPPGEGVPPTAGTPGQDEQDEDGPGQDGPGQDGQGQERQGQDGPAPGGPSGNGPVEGGSSGGSPSAPGSPGQTGSGQAGPDQPLPGPSAPKQPQADPGPSAPKQPAPARPEPRQPAPAKPDRRQPEPKQSEPKQSEPKGSATDTRQPAAPRPAAR